MEASSFQVSFYGEGYSEGQDPSQGKPNGKIRTVVQGPGKCKLKLTRQDYYKTELVWLCICVISGLQFI